MPPVRLARPVLRLSGPVRPGARRSSRAGLLVPAPPAGGRHGDAGLFGPGSEVWRIGRERVLLAAGPAALLLQLAHPLVAAGVAEHSTFPAGALARLRGTLDATLSVVFGDGEQAAAAAARVAARHRTASGRLPERVGALPAGTPYRADDPRLAQWVHATLVWTALEFYDGFVAPLPLESRARYTWEMDRSARLFGVPGQHLLGTYAGLQSCVRGMDEEGVLEVGPTARALAEQVVAAGSLDLPGPLGSGASRLTALLAAGLLPPRLRRAYGLSWSAADRAAFAAAQRSSRAALPLLPARVRFWPHYRSALSRLRA